MPDKDFGSLRESVGDIQPIDRATAPCRRMSRAPAPARKRSRSPFDAMRRPSTILPDKRSVIDRGQGNVYVQAFGHELSRTVHVQGVRVCPLKSAKSRYFLGAH